MPKKKIKVRRVTKKNSSILSRLHPLKALFAVVILSAFGVALFAGMNINNSQNVLGASTQPKNITGTASSCSGNDGITRHILSAMQGWNGHNYSTTANNNDNGLGLYIALNSIQDKDVARLGDANLYARTIVDALGDWLNHCNKKGSGYTPLQCSTATINYINNNITSSNRGNCSVGMNLAGCGMNSSTYCSFTFAPAPAPATPVAASSCTSKQGKCVANAYVCNNNNNGSVIANTTCSGKTPVCCKIPTKTACSGTGYKCTGSISDCTSGSHGALTTAKTCTSGYCCKLP
jgi:hypothetical protein